MLCVATPFHPTSKEKGRTGGRNHSSRPASTASLSTSKGTSCGPLVCLCCNRVAVLGRSFPSARVIVVVLPLPSVLNVFPSVEPTTIVSVCVQFAGFEQNWHFEELYCFVVYPSYCHVIIILCDVGGRGPTGVIREPRHRPLLLVSYRTARMRESPQPTGRGTKTNSLWRPRPPMIANH